MGIKIMGVMTGTSCDGLDAACLEIDREHWRPLWSATAPYPKNLRKRVLDMQKPGVRVALLEWLKLERDLGRWYADSLAKIIRKKSSKHRPDVIANHGQTIAHFPGHGITLQAGDPAPIARATGISIVTRFRDGDLAAGGEGAPLVPGFHRLLAGDQTGISIHNIGGISNFSYIGKHGQIIAFDTGPGNAWIDAAVEHATRGREKIDRDGRLASMGRADSRAISALLKFPYFRKAPPKSTGRDDFPFELLLSKTRARGADLVATATWFTAASIADAYQRFILSKRLPLRTIYVCGGGAKNPALMLAIHSLIDPIRVTTLEELGLDSQSLEAQAFAYFGYLALLGLPIGGSWTGASGFAPPAHLIPGANWTELLKKMSSAKP